MWDRNFIAALSKAAESVFERSGRSVSIDQLIEVQPELFRAAQKCYLAFKKYSREICIRDGLIRIALSVLRGRKPALDLYAFVEASYSKNTKLFLVWFEKKLCFMIRGENNRLLKEMMPAFEKLGLKKGPEIPIEKLRFLSYLYDESKVEEVARNLAIFRVLFGD